MIHPAGVFNDVRIVDHGFDKSKNGAICLWVKFESDEGNVVGRFYLTEKAAEYTLDKIAVMGFAGDDLAELADGTAMRDNLVQITVEHDTWEDKTSAKIAFVNENHSTGGLKRDDAAAANVKNFNALWRTKAKKTPEKVQEEPPF